MRLHQLLTSFGIAVALIILTLFALGMQPGATVASAAVFVTNSTFDTVDANPGDGLCATAGGDCTLRAAIQEANALPGADTISLISGTYILSLGSGGEDNALFGDLDITDDLTINGQGIYSTVIEANAIDRVFDIFSATVTLSNLTLKNGRADDGAGIYNRGHLSLNDTRVFSNVATKNGGGIFVNDGVLVFESGEIVDNLALNDGGGVFLSKGSLFNQNGGNIINNQADDEGGGVFVSSSNTINKENQTEANLVGSTFNQNGGTIQNNSAKSGGGIFIFQSQATLDGGQITFNNASNWGGGVHVIDSSYTVVSGAISANSANVGGGVYVFQGDVTINGGILNSNAVINHGGAIFASNNSVVTVNGGEISNNSANRDGGGVYVAQGDVTLNSGQIQYNNSSQGGGIYVNEGSFTQAGGILYQNSSGSGGGFYIADGSYIQTAGVIQQNTASNGGGAFLSGGMATLSNAQIISNTAYGSGGGVYVANGMFEQTDGLIKYNMANSYGGGVYLNGGSFSQQNGHIEANTASSYGGGVYINNGKFIQNNSFIEYNQNTSNDGGGVYMQGGWFTQTNSTLSHNQTQDDGGGIYLQGGQVYQQDSIIEDNYAQDSGGGIYMTGGTYQQINTSLRANNAGFGNGGGVIIYGGIYKNDSSPIENNTAWNDGGGLYLRGGSAYLTKTNVAQNNSGFQGGGIYVRSTTLVQNQGSVKHNSSGYNGGGAFVDESGVLSHSKVLVQDNQAINYGGGVYVNQGLYQALNSTVEENSAGHGAGIFSTKGTVQFKEGTITNNSGVNGGGLYAENNSVVSLVYATIEQNDASLLGGGIYNTTGQLSLFDTIVRLNSANSGGGIYSLASTGDIIARSTIYNNITGGNASAGSMTVVNGQMKLLNSTISSNQTPNGQAGGLYIEQASLAITNTTIASNTGNGVYLEGPSNNVSFKNSILSGNTLNCAGDAQASSLGHNLSNDTTCLSLSATGDITDTNPRLAPLANYGGNTPTHALYRDTIAIDAGDNNGCPTRDQRGTPRPLGPACDIGAYEHDNAHDNAIPLESGIPTADSTSAPDEVKWYAVDVPEPNSILTVTLSNLTDDYDLYLFAPGYDDASSDQYRDLGADIGFLGADIGFLGADIGFLGADIGFLGADIGFLMGNSGDLQDASEIDAQSLHRSVCESDHTGLLGNVAQLGNMGTLVCVSAQPSVTTEIVAADVQALTGRYYVGVNGRAIDGTAKPYSITVEITPPSIPYQSITYTVQTTYTTPTTDTTVQTLILYNQSRLEQFYTNTAAITALKSKLNTLTGNSKVNGKIIELDNYSAINFAYQVWDSQPANPLAANFVAAHIKYLIYALRGPYPNLKYVVVAGNDNIIPHYRIQDENLYANEYNYKDLAHTERISGAFASRFFLSDDYYVGWIPLTWRSRELYLPQVPIGRLVESPSEMKHVVDTFLSTPTITVDDSFVTGYDFVIDQANYISQTLASYNVPTVDTLINNTWTVTDFRQAYFSQPAAHSFNSLNGHFDHFRLFPNDVTYFIYATEIASSTTSFDSSLHISVGCHAGLNIADAEAVHNEHATDWSQALLREGATFIGNTGFGYGYNGLIAYSERLATNFVEELGYWGNGQPTVGNALILAKQRYYNNALTLNTYDEKVLGEMTLYGLPMMGVSVPNTTTKSTKGPNIAKAMVAQGSGEQALKDALTGTINFPLTGTVNLPLSYSPVVTDNGIYYTISGVESAGLHIVGARPVEPRFSYDVHLDNAVARGVLMTGGAFEDTQNFDPLITRVITDEVYPDLEAEPSYPVDTWYPAKTGTLNRYLKAGGIYDERLVVVPGQFRPREIASTADSTRGTQRLYTSLDFTVYYAPLTDTDFVAPNIWWVKAEQTPTELSFKTQVQDRFGEIQRVVMLYRGVYSNSWTLAEMEYNRFTHEAQVITPPISGTVYYFAQAVDNSGNVALALDHGKPFQTGPDDLDGPPPVGAEFVYLPLVLK